MKIKKVLFLILTLIITFTGCSHPKQPNLSAVSSRSDSVIVEEPLPNIPDFGEFVNEWDYLSQFFMDVNQQFIPDIIYAMLSLSVNGENIQVKVEIIEDKKNGKQYHVSNEEIDIWVSQNQLEIIYVNEKYPLEPIPDNLVEFYINYLNWQSETKNFIFVDIRRQSIHIFENINGYFFLIKTFPCATGKISTPTKRGNYKIYDKGPIFYNEEKFYKCYYWLKYSGQYLLHSVPYTLEGEILNTSMQKKVSNGCIRMRYQDAKWLYENIDLNTSIWIN